MQTEKTIVFEKERDFSDVLNATFEFLRQEFLPLLKVLALYTSVPTIILGIIQSFYMKGNLNNVLSNIVNQGVSNNSEILVWIPWLMLASLISYIFILGITLEYMNQYHQKGRGQFSHTDVWNGFLQNLGKLIGLNIISGLALIFAMLMLIIPGIWLAIVIMLMCPILVFEKASISQSWSRAFFLIRSNWWRTFGIIIVITIIQSILSSILSIPAIIYGVILGIRGLEGSIQEVGNNPVIISFSIVSAIVTAWLNVLTILACAFHFFSLREKKENNDILRRIEKINSENE